MDGPMQNVLKILFVLWVIAVQAAVFLELR